MIQVSDQHDRCPTNGAERQGSMAIYRDPLQTGLRLHTDKQSVTSRAEILTSWLEAFY